MSGTELEAGNPISQEYPAVKELSAFRDPEMRRSRQCVSLMGDI